MKTIPSSDRHHKESHEMKNSLNFHGARVPAQDLNLALNLNQHLAVETLPSILDGDQTLPAHKDHRLYFPALREMSEFDDYRVALVIRREWDGLQQSADPIPPGGRSVLLPFSWKELVAGVCEFVRESNSLAQHRVAQFADICVDFFKMEVSRLSGEVIALTNQEFKTLKCFLSHPDRVFSRDELLNEAWGYGNYPSTRTVDNHVLRLRQKLERNPARPVHFRTVHCVGYKFVP
jgi:DNA-binding winged helix-turn-helix (wHTH) protein